MYQCKHFKIQELVPPHIYDKRGDKAWELLDERALITLDHLRDHFGVAITINNWLWGGDRKWSGLRTPDSPHYSETSQHSYGRAFDCLFQGLDTQTVRTEIINNKDIFGFITGIELGVSWLHFDCRNCQPIKAFYP